MEHLNFFIAQWSFLRNNLQQSLGNFGNSELGNYIAKRYITESTSMAENSAFKFRDFEKEKYKTMARIRNYFALKPTGFSQCSILECWVAFKHDVYFTKSKSFQSQLPFLKRFMSYFRDQNISAILDNKFVASYQSFLKGGNATVNPTNFEQEVLSYMDNTMLFKQHDVINPAFIQRKIQKYDKIITQTRNDIHLFKTFILPSVNANNPLILKKAFEDTVNMLTWLDIYGKQFPYSWLQRLSTLLSPGSLNTKINICLTIGSQQYQEALNLNRATFLGDKFLNIMNAKMMEFAQESFRKHNISIEAREKTYNTISLQTFCHHLIHYWIPQMIEFFHKMRVVMHNFANPILPTIIPVPQEKIRQSF